MEGLEISRVDEKVEILDTNRNKPFDAECSELANKRKQKKLLWLQNQNNQTAEDFSNARPDTCTMFRKKKRDYIKAKVNKLEENSKNKNIRGNV